MHRFSSHPSDVAALSVQVWTFVEASGASLKRTKLQQKVKMFPSCCLLFSMFRLAWSLLGLFTLTPTESQDGAIQFQLTGVCSFKAVLWKLYGSLRERRMIVMYASLENQCRVKQNMSCILASLWINVHSVKKINWINTINSPQRCTISLPHSISNRTVFVFKK